VRRRLSGLCVVVLMLAAVACTTPRASALAPHGLRAALGHGMGVTALGDSVPYGYACACTPYPQLTGAALSRVVGHPVRVTNDAIPGYRTSYVLHQLGESGVIADVRRSGVFVVEIGANDVGYSSTCGTQLSCYLPKVPTIDANIRQIVDRLRQLTTGRTIEVVLVDYWNVWLGGRYAAAHGPAYVETAVAVTQAVDDVIRSDSGAERSRYVDLRTAFKGQDHDRDETDLLAPDGDHPNAAGQQRIAAVVEQALLA
jgi:acyl-CoA thioesterase I